jgi:hypothetical protein
MEIKRIDIHSFVHLRDVVAMKCNDENIIKREMYSMAKCII